MSAELVQIVGATRTPATGRPCSSRTTPPIVSAGYIARVYDAGISSSRIGLGNQSVTGANPSLRATTDRNPDDGAGTATAARPASSVVVRLPRLPIDVHRERDARQGLAGPLVHDAEIDRWGRRGRPRRSWRRSAGPSPRDATGAGASRPSRANEPPRAMSQAAPTARMIAPAARNDAASLSFATIIARNTPSASSRAAAEAVAETAVAVAARARVATVAGDQRGRDRGGCRLAARRQGGQPGGRRQAAAGQAVFQLLPRPVEPPAHAPRRASQPPRRLLVRPALEVAEHHRPAVLLRQPADLLIDHRPELGPFQVAGGFHGLGPGALRFLGRAPGRVAPDAGSDAIGHAVQPGAERLGVAQRTGLAQQDEERGLEGVLDVATVVEQPPADAQDHRSVPRHQRLERRPRRRPRTAAGAAPRTGPSATPG